MIVVIDDISCLSKAEMAQVTPLAISQQGIHLWLVAQDVKQVPPAIRHNSRVVDPTLKRLMRQNL